MIGPGQVCTTPDGRDVEEEMHQGVRSWGNSAVGETVLLTGVYLLEGEVSRRLLRSLPRTSCSARRARTPRSSTCSRTRCHETTPGRTRCSTGCSTCC